MTLDDVRRSLSQMFGDGAGNYPPGAYLDSVQIHNLVNPDPVDTMYEGLGAPDPKAEWIGALAALRDVRDGTNLTGLNPKEEKVIRNIGMSGQFSAPVLMQCMQRETSNVLGAILVAINANDRCNFSHQCDVIPGAAAKNMGIIAMKVFSDGAMYGKDGRFSRQPDDLIRSVGSQDLPSADLIRYSLSTPGTSTAFIGIGRIDTDKKRHQLEQNLAAARLSDGIDETERRRIEQQVVDSNRGFSNYFQRKAEVLGGPRQAVVPQKFEGDQRVALLTGQTAYAGDQPLSHYEIQRDDFRSVDFGAPAHLETAVGRFEHRPQTTKEPFTFTDTLKDRSPYRYRVIAVDVQDKRGDSGDLFLSPAQ